MSGSVLVTGASRGIGREVARLLVRVGYDVVGVFRSDVKAAAQLEIETAGRARLLQADLVVPDAVDQVAAEIEHTATPLVGVVLGAGMSMHAPFVETRHGDADPLTDQLAADLGAPLLLLRALMRRPRKRFHGRLVLHCAADHVQ